MKLAVLTTDAFTDPNLTDRKPARVDPAILRSVLSECIMKLDAWVQATHAETHASISPDDLNTDRATRPELARYILHNAILDGMRELCSPLLRAQKPEVADVYATAVSVNQYLSDVDMIALSNDEAHGYWKEMAIIVPIEGHAQGMGMHQRDLARVPCVTFAHSLTGHFAYAAVELAFEQAKHESEQQAFLDALEEFGTALNDIIGRMRAVLPDTGPPPGGAQVIAFPRRNA